MTLAFILAAVCLILLILKKGDIALGVKAFWLTFYIVAKERPRPTQKGKLT